MSARMDYFIPARTRIGAGFLERYLPPMAANVIAAYVEATSSPGDLILDPFCQSPASILGAVSQGRRILACNFNPIDTFAVHQSLSPLSPRQLDAATTRLSQSRRGGDTLRDHVLHLYRCLCPSCRRMAVADYFVWNVAQKIPVEKYVRCQGCGFEGASMVQADDLSVLGHIEDRGLTYFFVLDRVALAKDAARHDAERLLGLYTHRARYALAHMVMKTEAEFAGTLEEGALKYLILACLIRGGLFNRPSSLGGKPLRRRDDLGVERNVWLLFEEAWDELRQRLQTRQPVPMSALAGREGVTDFLQGAIEHDAAIVHCSLRSLTRTLPPQSVQSVVTGLFTPNQRYWRLCFLWAGWLFGREKAAYLRPLIRQSTPDWAWYTRTLAAAFRALRSKLRLPGYMAVLLSSRRNAQAEAVQLATAVQLAAAASRLNPLSYVYGSTSVAKAAHGTGEYRLLFAKGSEVMEGIPQPPDLRLLQQEVRKEAVQGALDALKARGEPLPIGWLRNAALARLSRRGSLGRVMLHQSEGFSGYDFIQKHVEEALAAERHSPLMPSEWEARFAPDAVIPMLCARETLQAAAPLGDRVEEAALQILRDALLIRREDYEDALYKQFPGLQTPEHELVEACLASYGEETTPGYWRLRGDAQAEQVQRTSEALVSALKTLGERMGLEVELDASPYSALWKEGGLTFAFYFLPTAVLGLLAELPPPVTGTSRYVIILDERLALLRMKLHRSPIYGRILHQGGWTFIRQPYLLELLKAPEVDRHSLKRIGGLDPIVEKGEAQIPLF